jgi:hypothetical protein
LNKKGRKGKKDKNGKRCKWPKIFVGMFFRFGYFRYTLFDRVMHGFPLKIPKIAQNCPVAGLSWWGNTKPLPHNTKNLNKITYLFYYPTS